MSDDKDHKDPQDSKQAHAAGGEEPSANKAGKEPSANKVGKEPSADKAGKEPSANKAGKEPSADKEPSANQKPSANKSKSSKPATAKILDEISRNTGSKTASARKSAGQRSSGGARFISGLIVMLPILAAVAYLAWQQLQLQQTLASLDQQNQQLQATIATRDASQDSQIQQLQQQSQQPPPEIPDNSAALEQLASNLNSEIDNLRQQLGQLQSNQVTQTAEPDFSWKVFEAEYLVSQAALKLQLEADLASAISLLEQADAALVASNHSGAFNLRQALADDLASLRNSEPVDREGLYLRLDNMIADVSDLDLLNSMRENFDNRRANESVQVALTESDSGWWSAGLDFLGEVFVWRRWEERPEAMLAPGQETLIKLNLRLQLKQAQLALLDADQEAFRRSLDETREILTRYAVTDSAGGRSLSNELQALQGENINPPLPSLSDSLRLARQLAESER